MLSARERRRRRRFAGLAARWTTLFGAFRRCSKAVAAGLTVCASLAGIAPVGAAAETLLKPGIFGDDDRVIAADDPRYHAVGRLNLGGHGFCTATLIAPDWIVTAAHCLHFPRTGRPMTPDRLHFHAGYRSGRAQAHLRGAEIVFHPDFIGPRPNSLGQMGVDLAFVRLGESAPAEIQPLALSIDDPFDSPLHVISYARDRRELPSIERGCARLDLRHGVLATNCDSNHGASGAPILVDTPFGVGVTGVISGVVRGADGPVTIAAKIGAQDVQRLRPAELQVR